MKLASAKPSPFHPLVPFLCVPGGKGISWQHLFASTSLMQQPFQDKVPQRVVAPLPCIQKNYDRPVPALFPELIQEHVHAAFPSNLELFLIPFGTGDIQRLILAADLDVSVFGMRSGLELST